MIIIEAIASLIFRGVVGFFIMGAAMYDLITGDNKLHNIRQSDKKRFW